MVKRCCNKECSASTYTNALCYSSTYTNALCYAITITNALCYSSTYTNALCYAITITNANSNYNTGSTSNRKFALPKNWREGCWNYELYALFLGRTCQYN